MGNFLDQNHTKIKGGNIMITSQFKFKFFILTIIIFSLTFSVSANDKNGGKNKKSIFEHVEELIELNKNINKNKSKIINVLKNYYPELQNLEDLKDKNPFLEGIYVKTEAEISNTRVEISEKKIQSLTGTSSIIAGTIPKLLVQRFKEELKIEFFDKLTEFIKDKDEFKKLFPSICFVINSNVPKNYKTYLESLKSAAKTDMENLPFKILNYRDLEPIFPGFDKLYKTSISILNIIKDFKNKNISLIFTDENLKNLPFLERDSSLYKSLRFLNLLVRNLKSPDGKTLRKGIVDFFKNYKKAQLFIGLLYKKEEITLDNLTVGNKSLKTIFEENQKLIIRLFIKIIPEINQSIELIQKISDSIRRNTRFDLDDAQDILQQTKNIMELSLACLKVENAMVTEDIKKSFSIAKSFVGIIESIRDKEYSQAFFQLSQIIAQLRNNKIEQDNSKMNENEIEKVKKDFFTKFLKYSNFLISILNSKSQDDMLKILEGFTLPAGSWRIKRQKNFSISLNSYIGLFPNFESESDDSEDENNNDPRFNLAIAAPVGISINLGIRWKKSPIGSISAFISIIDVGAPVRYYLTSDSSNNDKGLSEIKWGDIFSPGIFAIFGIKGSIFTIGAGVQLGPKLRDIDENGEQIISPNRLRGGFFISADITLIHFL